jgi:hypothetical protein
MLKASSRNASHRACHPGGKSKMDVPEGKQEELFNSQDSQAK